MDHKSDVARVREDMAAKRSHQHCTIVATRAGETVTIEEDHVLRLWTQDDFDRVIDASPFELVALYHDRFDPFPIEEPRTGKHGNLYHVLARRVGGPRYGAIFERLEAKP